MSSTAGKALTPEIKQVIVRLNHYFDDNKSRFNCRDFSATLTAEALAIGIATIHRVMANYDKDPESINVTPKVKARFQNIRHRRHRAQKLKYAIGSKSIKYLVEMTA